MLIPIDQTILHHISHTHTHTVGIQYFIPPGMSFSFVFNNFPTATAQTNKIQTQDRVFSVDTPKANLRKWWRGDMGQTNKPGAAILWSAT